MWAGDFHRGNIILLSKKMVLTGIYKCIKEFKGKEGDKEKCMQKGYFVSLNYYEENMVEVCYGPKREPTDKDDCFLFNEEIFEKFRENIELIGYAKEKLDYNIERIEKGKGSDERDTINEKCYNQIKNVKGGLLKVM